MLRYHGVESVGIVMCIVPEPVRMHAVTAFDAELIRRYERNTPRYTSYPPANRFDTGFTASDYRRAALLSNAAPATPLSAYVHVPFCESPCFYCGCNRVITRDRAQATRYVEHLKIEIEMQGRLFDRSRRIEQLHFGGGTPTFLTFDEMNEVMQHLDCWFSLDRSDRREVSIEVDPRTVTTETMPGLAALGFNRVSFGVQDFDPRVQKAVNRVQSLDLVRSATELARASGFRSVSFDLIYGLPRQSPASFERTLAATTRLRPDRIAVYGYAHLPELFKAQRALDERELPNAAQRLELLEMTVEMLTGAGYVHIGMDHFALPHDELARASRDGTLHRNFQGYSTRAACDLVGLGVSAIGAVGTAYAQNARRLDDYYAAIGRGSFAIERGLSLTMDDLARRDIIQQVMCGAGVDPHEIETHYALDFRQDFATELSELRRMASDGLLSEVEPQVRVSDKGRFLLRNIAAVFDRYLPAAPAKAYSRAI
jgi:oxygen-independent coproporphyrinogen-3 oxidase